MSVAHRVTAYVRGVEPQGYVLIQTTDAPGSGLAPGPGLGPGHGIELHSTSGSSSSGNSGNGSIGSGLGESVHLRNSGRSSGRSSRRSGNNGSSSGSGNNTSSGGGASGGGTSSGSRYETVLSVRNLTKQYTSGGMTVEVLSDVGPAELREGSVTCLLGSNGAGKVTTTITTTKNTTTKNHHNHKTITTIKNPSQP